MNRVATNANYSSILANLMRAQFNQSQANNQVSSGKVASDLKGYANDAETLAAAQSVKSRVDTFIDQGKILSAKLQSQDLALNSIADAAQAARQAIANALAADKGDSVMGDLGAQFNNAVSGLNSKFQGRYLFAGGQVNTQPVTATQMSDLTAASSVASLFQNDNLTPTSQLDESTTIQTGFLADGLGTNLFNAFKAVQSFAQGPGGPFSGQLTPAQRTFLQGQLAVFDGVRSGLTNAAAQNGLIQNRADGSQKTQVARQTMLTGMIGDVTDVNMADAVTKLQQAQLQVQASAQVFSMLQGSSLLNFLR